MSMGTLQNGKHMTMGQRSDREQIVFLVAAVLIAVGAEALMRTVQRVVSGGFTPRPWRCASGRR